MTREMCHTFYKEFQNDPAIGHYYEYVYSVETADHYFERNAVPERKLFAILVDDQIVGECKLKDIDLEKRECSMGIHLQNDAVKGKGYGTQAERLILKYAFEEMGMVAVNADVALKNTRSQHVLEKVGFRYTHEDDTFKYYRCDANKADQWKKVKDLMGKAVHVIVDRPIGYQHGDIVYPINYGYIPGLTAGDGEEQDAYILGVNEPLAEFDGQVVAAICRKNDCEDKLVVAPVGMVYHQGEIAEAVHFQEQHFAARIISCFEKSCGVLPYRIVNGEQEFLLVFETYSQCWSLPKGHVEAGESDVQTALRELHEETGLSAELDVSRCASIEYPIFGSARKQVVFFLGQVKGEPRVREGEIDKYKWVAAKELKVYLLPDTVAACTELLQ
jgi:RimJ/RimL family protein N-acetyltransferase/8-oxo-dGTP pyrophosphatase MutT (NUDIX family)